MANILKTEPAFTGNRIKVKRKFMCFEDDHRETWEFIEMNEGVSIIPMDEDGFVYLLNEYALAEEKNILTPSKGLIDEGETPEMAASRELKEEMGLRAEQFIRLGEFYAMPSYSNARTTIYLAKGVTQCHREGGDEHHHLDVAHMPFTEALQMLEHGRIKSALTSNALLLAKMHMDKHKK
jgi:8-oxo-dGTP pyrophosphatase MutT (NUDIX family)